MFTSRREFLSLALGAGAAALTASAWGKAPRGLGRMGCNSWPFRGYFDTPRMHDYRDAKYPLLTQEQFPEFLADTFGIHDVEFLAGHFVSGDAGEVERVRRGLAKARSRCINIMDVSLPGGAYTPGLDPAATLAFGRQWIEIARALGAPSATFPLGGPRGGGAPATATAAANLRPILAYARSRGALMLFHNDDIRRESAPQLAALIRALGPGTGMCPDFGNFAPRSAAYALATLRQLAPFAHNICHSKDGIAEDGKFYADDFPGSMAAMRAAGFRGAYSLEFEGLGEPIPGVRALLAKTLQYL